MKLNAYLQVTSLAIVCLSVGFGLGRHHAPPTHSEYLLLPAQSPQAAQGAAPRDSYQFFDSLVDLRSRIVHNYVEKVDDEKLRLGAIKGMMAELDQYSNYFTREELATFDKSVHGEFTGIGAEISRDPTTGAFIIVSPLEDSPALKAGVFAGDRILKLNDEPVDGWPLEMLLSKITGEPNSELRLSVLHEGDKDPVELTIVRQVIRVHSVRGVSRAAAEANGQWDYLIDSQNRIAYVRISNFMEETAEDLDKALLPLINDRPAGSLKGIILDLRFNPGGLLQAGVEVTRRFLDSGVIVSTGRPDTQRRDLVIEATPGKAYPRIPLVVLVNEYSASASEIVAGAIRDHRRGILIGSRTFGKGSVQSVINLDNGNAAIKLTTQYYYLPGGSNITRKKDATEWGVEPDAIFNIPLTDEENRAVLLARRGAEIIHRGAAPSGTAPAGAEVPSPSADTRPAEPSDRQLQRALEVLIAYQSFGPRPDVPPEVTTTRPGASASVPGNGSRSMPASQPAAPPLPDAPQ